MADASTSGLIVRLQHSPNHFRQRRVLGDRVDGDPPRDRPRPGPRENPDRQQLIVVKGSRCSCATSQQQLPSGHEAPEPECRCSRRQPTGSVRVFASICNPPPASAEPRLAARHLSTLRRPLPTRHATASTSCTVHASTATASNASASATPSSNASSFEYAESSSLTSSSRDQVCATMPPNDQWRRKKRDHLDSMAPPPTLTSSRIQFSSPKNLPRFSAISFDLVWCR